jgi:hypothetical protein
VARYLDDWVKEQRVFCAENSKEVRGKVKTFIVDLESMTKLQVKKKESVRRWDFLSTLKPPEYLSIENGTIYSTVVLKPGSPDYDFVSHKFIATFNGRVNQGGLPAGLGGANWAAAGVPAQPNFGVLNNFGFGGGANIIGQPLGGG